MSIGFGLLVLDTTLAYRIGIGYPGTDIAQPQAKASVTLPFRMHFGASPGELSLCPGTGLVIPVVVQTNIRSDPKPMFETLATKGSLKDAPPEE